MRTDFLALAAAFAIATASAGAAAQQPASGIPTAETENNVVIKRQGQMTDETMEDEEADTTSYSEESLVGGGTDAIRAPVESAPQAPMPGERVGENDALYLGQNPTASGDD
jgi:hypothetical protein